MNLGKLFLVVVATCYTIPACATELHAATVQKPDFQRQGIRVVGSPKLTADREVETLSGPAALSHLQNLVARKNRAFESSIAHLSSRGLRPTEQVVVFRSKRTVGTPDSKSGGSSYLPSTEISIPEGELVFWSWDDGDPSTWEGTMYAESYTNGGYVISDGQIDTAIQDTTWEETIAYEPGGHGPDIRKSRGNGDTVAFNGNAFIKDWLGCVVGNCVLGIAGCMFSGPLYVECVFIACHAAVIACALSTIIAYL